MLEPSEKEEIIKKIIQELGINPTLIKGVALSLIFSLGLLSSSVFYFGYQLEEARNQGVLIGNRENTSGLRNEGRPQSPNQTLDTINKPTHITITSVLLKKLRENLPILSLVTIVFVLWRALSSGGKDLPKKGGIQTQRDLQ